MSNTPRFKCAMIRGMKTKTGKPIAPQMTRLYQAAMELRQVEGKSAVARLLNITPQNLNHWEDGRPISSEALLKAQELIGCDAIWLRDGTGDMLRGGQGAPPADLHEVAELIALYGQSTERGREVILDAARSTRKVAGLIRFLPMNKA